MGSKTVVVFDVDDTLYLERDYVRSGFSCVGRWVGEQLGVPGFGDRCWAAFESGGRGDTFDVVARELDLDAAALVPELVELYRGHFPSIAPLPDAVSAVEDIGRRSALAVVTDGPEASQAAKVAALGCEAWADPVILTARYGAGFSKPHPRAFEEIQHAAGVFGADCAYVADNPTKDFAGPRSLGWRTVRVRRPHSLHEQVDSGEDVDVELPDLSGLDELLRSGDART